MPKRTDPDQKLECLIGFRVTARTYARIVEAAAADQRSVADWARLVILRELEKESERD